MNIKKHFALTMLVALVSSLSATAHDFEAVYQGQTFYFNILSENTCAVSYRGNYSDGVPNEYKYSGDVKIPSSIEYNGQTYSVTSIGDKAFYWCYNLTSVFIPESVTSICEKAFLGCSELQRIDIESLETWCKIDFEDPDANPLFGNGNGNRSLYVNGILTTEIIIPETITEIKAASFAGSSITKIQLHSNVKKIGNWAFLFSALAEINIPESVEEIGYLAFFQTPWNTNILKYGNDGLCYINNVLYSCKSGTTTANIKFGTVSIAGGAFNPEIMQGKSNTSLTSVSIPSSVKTIGANAFAGCTCLSTINIPEGVEEVGRGAFSGCDALIDITIPTTLKKVGNNAFSVNNIKSDRNVYIKDLAAWCNIDFEGDNGTSNPLVHYNSNVSSNLYLNNTLLEELVVPDGITEIKNHAFIFCSSLTSLVLPNGLKSIGKLAFRGCININSQIEIPNGVECIENSSFAFCEKIESVSLPKSLKTIKKWAFESNKELTSISLPYSLKDIEDEAFENCTNLNPTFRI